MSETMQELQAQLKQLKALRDEVMVEIGLGEKKAPSQSIQPALPVPNLDQARERMQEVLRLGPAGLAKQSQDREAKLPAPSEALTRSKGTDMILGENFENAPIIGATLATLPLGGAGAVPALAARLGGPAAARFLAPKLIQGLGRVSKPAAETAEMAVRAGAGGGLGGLAEGELTGADSPVDVAIQRAKEQGVIEPVSRITLGLAKFLTRPAGKFLKVGVGDTLEAAHAKALRVLDFAKKERLDFDPSAMTNQILPNVLTRFAKDFVGARVTLLSRKKMEGMVNHISAEAGNQASFINRMIAQDLPDVAPKRLKLLEDVVFKSGVPAGEKQFFVVNGDLLGEQIRKNRKRLTKAYGEKLVERLDNFALYAKVNAQIPFDLSDNLLLSRKVAMTSLAVGGIEFAASPLSPGILSTAASNVIASQIFHPKTKFNQWLTTGLIPESVLNVATPIASLRIRREGEDFLPFAEKTAGAAMKIGEAVGPFASRAVGIGGRLGARAGKAGLDILLDQ